MADGLTPQRVDINVGSPLALVGRCVVSNPLGWGVYDGTSTAAESRRFIVGTLTVTPPMSDHDQTDKGGGVNEDGDAVSALFDALGHSRRRKLVFLLGTVGGQELSLREAARYIAMLERGPDVSTRQITHVRTSLKRSHRQSLETAAIVDIEQGQISPGRNFRRALWTLAVAHPVT
jgi:hypothetical protein